MDWHGEKRYAIYENFQLANEQVRNGERSDLLALVCEAGAAAYAASDQYQGLYLQLCETCLLWFPGLPSFLTDKQPWDQGHEPRTFSLQLSAQVSGGQDHMFVPSC